MSRDRWFAAVTVCTLVLGIASTATVFSVVDRVLFRPLPHADPGRLVTLTGQLAKNGEVPLSIPEFFDLRDRTTVFSQIATVLPISVTLTGVAEPERIEARAVSGGFSSLLGVAPLLGRTFTLTDESPGITEIGVISYALWQRSFAGRDDVLGKVLRLDDDAYRIVGVMPRTFEHPGETRDAPVDFWYPAGFRATPFPRRCAGVATRRSSRD